jgi:hypothetical protein
MYHFCSIRWQGISVYHNTYATYVQLLFYSLAGYIWLEYNYIFCSESDLNLNTLIASVGQAFISFIFALTFEICFLPFFGSLSSVSKLTVGGTNDGAF